MLGHLSPQGGPRIVSSKPAAGPADPSAPPRERPMNRGEMARAARDAATQTGRATRTAPGSNSAQPTSMADMMRGPRQNTKVCPQPLFGASDIPPQLQLACSGLTDLKEAIEWSVRARDILTQMFFMTGLSPESRTTLATALEAANALVPAVAAAPSLSAVQSSQLCSLALTIAAVASKETANLIPPVAQQIQFFMGFLAVLAKKAELAAKPKMSGAKKAAIALTLGAVGGGAVYWFWKHRQSPSRSRRRRALAPA